MAYVFHSRTCALYGLPSAFTHVLDCRTGTRPYVLDRRTSALSDVFYCRARSRADILDRRTGTRPYVFDRGTRSRTNVFHGGSGT